jgi:hypothetical protein
LNEGKILAGMEWRRYDSSDFHFESIFDFEDFLVRNGAFRFQVSGFSLDNGIFATLVCFKQRLKIGLLKDSPPQSSVSFRVT